MPEHDGRRPPAGLYDEPITRARDAGLTKLSTDLVQVEELEEHEAPTALGRLLYERIVGALASVSGEDKVEEQLALANHLLEELRRRAPKSRISADDDFASPARRLLAVLAPAEPPARPQAPPRPSIHLASSDLLTNGPHDLSLGPEVEKEIASADRIDLLCSFLKWTGLRLVEGALRELLRGRRRDAHGRAPLRVLTTAYMMATERRALDALVEMGADVRVSYDTTQTRLHAKAWLFHRATGFSTACIGSSNLSAAAMLDGLEWNVRLSTVDNGAILEKFASTFEQYWEDESTFRPYDPAEFDAVVQRAQRSALLPYLVFDITPKPHQREILEDLAAERAHGHLRNLVVAATGTGKTIVAALDYKRLRPELPRDRLLFVAHRAEILDQSLRAFQVVLRDGSFGETLVGGRRPVQWEHVFASIQSLDEARLAEISPDHFDVVIVDEFHHAAAKSYDDLLRHFRPRVLLGLTATPERADGRSILHHFDDRVASELRLWHALDGGLLSPFHYFGIGGAPGLTGVKWSRGRYDVAAVGNLYTADHLFAQRVVQETGRKVSDVSKMRALGFCVDVAHAAFMARVFTSAGIPSAAVTAETKPPARKEALAALRAGELRCLFSVDLFNEGVDLPDVDTVLFLRPTESATVFLQQLGRGLRRSERKECLTVLDFIGDANRKFRFDLRYRAIVGGTRRSIEREIERGFPSLPSGCVIQLDRQAHASVLANIRAQLGAGARALVEDLRGLGPSTTLAAFCEAAGVDLEDVYANGRCWTTLRRSAGFAVPPPGPDDVQLERAFSRMLHVDDPARLTGISTLLRSPTPPRAATDDAVQRMLFMLLGYVRRPLSDMQRAWDALWASPALREELALLVAILDDRVRRVTRPLDGGPLHVHATYSLDEILAAFDERNTKGGVKRIQTGVYFVERAKTDLLFVTLEKSERDYSPTTLYNDYAISATRFHWESQSNCHEETSTGRRYIRTTPGGGTRVVLFVRQRRTDARGETMPYTLLGRAFYLEHRGGRPMQIQWELEAPMPAGLYQQTKVAAG
jgi:superfamily II DNA or RNA helicase/HKD family nuclease